MIGYQAKTPRVKHSIPFTVPADRGAWPAVVERARPTILVRARGRTASSISSVVLCQPARGAERDVAIGLDLVARLADGVVRAFTLAPLDVDPQRQVERVEQIERLGDRPRSRPK